MTCPQCRMVIARLFLAVACTLVSDRQADAKFTPTKLLKARESSRTKSFYKILKPSADKIEESS